MLGLLQNNHFCKKSLFSYVFQMKEIVCPKVCTPTRCTPGGGLMCFCFMIFAAKMMKNIRPPLPCATSWLHTVLVTHPSRAFYYAIPAGAAVSFGPTYRDQILTKCFPRVLRPILSDFLQKNQGLITQKHDFQALENCFSTNFLSNTRFQGPEHFFYQS